MNVDWGTSGLQAVGQGQGTRTDQAKPGERKAEYFIIDYGHNRKVSVGF